MTVKKTVRLDEELVGRVEEEAGGEFSGFVRSALREAVESSGSDSRGEVAVRELRRLGPRVDLADAEVALAQEFGIPKGRVVPLVLKPLHREGRVRVHQGLESVTVEVVE